MRIYFDVCCLNRPTDDQSQERIRLESDAVESIFRLCQSGRFEWVISEAVFAEVEANPDEDRRNKVLALLKWAHTEVTISDLTTNRAAELMRLGLAAMDSLHIAASEESKSDVLLTTDDRLIRLAARLSDRLNVRVENPARWIAEETIR